MFRRSKIKITPKIPQAKPSGDRANVESLTHVQPSTNLNETNISKNSDQPNQVDKVEIKNKSTLEPLEPTSIISTPKILSENATVPVVDLESSSSLAAETITERVESQSGVHKEKIVDNTIIEKNTINEETNEILTDIPPEKTIPIKEKANEAAKKPQSVQKLTTFIEPVDDLPEATEKQVTKELPKESPTITSPIIRDKLSTETIRPRKRIKISPKDLLDRSSITLYHLIHAPISRGKRSDKNKSKDNDKEKEKAKDKDKDKDLDKDKKLDDEGDENLEKNSEEIEDLNKQETSPNTKLTNNEDTMDSVITTASSASTIITNNGENNVDTNKEKESRIGPRVKVGPDGELIIDEESLVIKKPKPVERETIEEPAYGKTTYSSFRKRPPTARWTKTETIEFYTALNLIGPDFSLMSNLFFGGKRSRTDLKNKFRRENKLNKSVIDKALYKADVEYCLAQEAVQGGHS